jgi:hypothetical protein
MAKVIKRSNGYEFVGLSTIGMRIVNEFQRQHPSLCEPTSDPDYRFIRQGSPEESVQLERLVVQVLANDPDRPPQTLTMHPRQ